MSSPINILVFLLLWTVMFVYGMDYQPILAKISSGSSYCNNEHLLKNFDLSEIPQFGAMCNIPIPRSTQVKFLLETNVMPILCMGLYDASLRLCKSSVDSGDNVFMDVFPPTTEKFIKVFKTLDESEEFSALNGFCSSTVTKFIITEPASNITEIWWNVLNQQFKSEDSCKSICRTNELNKVHPLCSYIIWSNGIYLNHLNNQVESQSNAVGGGQIDVVSEKESDQQPHKPIEELTQPLSLAENQNSLFTPSVGLMNSDSTLPQASITPVVPHEENSEPNTSVKLTGQAFGVKDQSVLEHKAVQESEPLKSSEPLKLSAISDNNTENNISTASVVKPPKKVESVKKNQEKDPAVQEKLPPPELNNEKALKSAGGSSAVDTTGPQQVETMPKASDNMDEGDFSLEVTPEGVGLEQPISPDKDLQQPYSAEEDVDDGDGDDVEIEPEGPVKSSPHRTGSNKERPSKPSSLPSDQGVVAEPDKAYGEVEREIIIEDHFIEAEDSHFFTYFLCMAVLTIMAYLAFHNKKKLVALAVEGKRTRGSRRRPNCSNYSKLDCSLEEALVSNTTASVTHVLY